MKPFLHWAPRILSILFCLFIMMFSFDVFEGNVSFIDILIGFIKHNLPVFAMAIIIFFAWQNNWVGGIGFLVISLFFFIMVNSNMNNGSGVMSPEYLLLAYLHWLFQSYTLWMNLLKGSSCDRALFINRYQVLLVMESFSFQELTQQQLRLLRKVRQCLMRWVLHFE